MSLEGASYAIPITTLLEITVPRDIRKDQRLTEIFEGTFEYRGTSIPVVNLKKVLQIPGKPGSGLIVMKSSKGLLGILVDGASELLETRERPAAIPKGVLSGGMNYYAGILKNRDDLVLLLNEEGLLP